MAEYRAGDSQAATSDLKNATQVFAGQLERINAFFRAMAHWRLDEKEEARKCYDQAVEWMEENQAPNEEPLPDGSRGVVDAERE